MELLFILNSRRDKEVWQYIVGVAAHLEYLAEAVIPRCARDSAALRWTAAVIVPVTRALVQDSLCYNLVRT